MNERRNVFKPVWHCSDEIDEVVHRGARVMAGKYGSG
jgi:hypothetical protein